MDEECSCFDQESVYEAVSKCKCTFNARSLKQIVKPGPEHEHLLSTNITRAENYLKERRIPELVRFLLTKLLVDSPNKPIIYMEKLLNDCMLFRAGHGLPPVLYEDRHLKAVVKSFDPGNRGWLSASQTRRAFITCGLKPDEILEDQITCTEVLAKMQETQESHLLDLLSAGTIQEIDNSSKSGSSI